MLLACVLFVASCRPKKEIVKAPQTVDTPAPVANKKAENIAMLLGKDIPFNTLSLRGKADLNLNGDENSVTINLRIKKDEKIWFSVTALGGAVEVARGVITPDSLKLMNRLRKKFVRKPFSYIHAYTNEQINFGWLQSILVGNSIKDFMVEKSELKQENGVWVLNGTEKGLAYNTLFNTLLKPVQLTLNDAKAGQGLKVNYDKYTPVNDALFPSNLKINSAVGNKKISLAVDFIKIDYNVAVDFPFTVPKSFELIN